MSWTLVTGAKGFIGSAVVRQLTSTGNPVAGVGHGSIPQPDLEVRQLDEWINGEVNFTNLQLLEQKLGPPAGVVHLAGGSSVGKSLQHPREDFSRTVESSVEVLEWIRQTCPHVPMVYASSAAVYGNIHSQPIPESTTLSPYSPYGSHKAIVEMLCRSYCENYGLSVSIVRLFSVYGPRLYKQLIYDLSVRLSKNPAVLELGGTGQEERDFLYVIDAAKLLCLALEWASPETPIVNGGTGTATSVATVAATCCTNWGCKPEVRFTGNSRAGDPFSLVANPTRSLERGFVPTVDFETGIRQTLEANATHLNR